MISSALRALGLISLIRRKLTSDQNLSQQKSVPCRFLGRLKRVGPVRGRGSFLISSSGVFAFLKRIRAYSLPISLAMEARKYACILGVWLGLIARKKISARWFAAPSSTPSSERPKASACRFRPSARAEPPLLLQKGSIEKLVDECFCR